MLAAAESDLDPQVIDRRIEQRRQHGISRRSKIKGEMGKQVSHQIGLMRTKLVAFAPSKEGALTVRSLGVGVIVIDGHDGRSTHRRV